MLRPKLQKQNLAKLVTKSVNAAETVTGTIEALIFYFLHPSNYNDMYNHDMHLNVLLYTCSNCNIIKATFKHAGFLEYLQQQDA